MYNWTYETHDVRMKSQNFFQQKLFPVINSEGVRRALRVKVGPGEVGVGVEICQQVVGHQPELVALEKWRCELKWKKYRSLWSSKSLRLGGEVSWNKVHGNWEIEITLL